MFMPIFCIQYQSCLRDNLSLNDTTCSNTNCYVYRRGCLLQHISTKARGAVTLCPPSPWPRCLTADQLRQLLGSLLLPRADTNSEWNQV